LPTGPGQNFSADIIRRCKQKIFTTRDVFSSFTTATLVQDESAPSMRSALLSTTSLLRQSACIVRVDGATGFVALKDDSSLKEQGITIDYGRVKNPNKNPVIDKGIQELEREFLTAGTEGQELSQAAVDMCLRRLNSRIRHSGLSAKEIITRRDQITGHHLDFADADLTQLQQDLREKNHLYSSKSKARGGKPAAKDGIDIGDLVFIKNEGDKFNRRSQYLVTNREEGFCMLQKMSNGKFMSKLLKVPVTDLFKVSEGVVPRQEHYIPPNSCPLKSRNEEAIDSSDDDFQVFNDAESDNSPCAVVIEPQASLENSQSDDEDLIQGEPAINDFSADIANDNSNNNQQSIAMDRPRRARRPPQRLLDEIFQQQQQ